MLKINNLNYDVIEKYIDFDPFEGKVDGRKRKGKALYITLITNDFKLSIETVYDIEWIKELKINDEKDISKYIITLPYEYKNVWMPLTDKCNCTLKRIDDKNYNIILKGHFEECDEKFDIEYNDTFKIDDSK